jgi:predicted nucleic acid-binding protein
VRVFVDSGGWLSILISTDQYHEAGTQYFKALISAKVSPVTTDFVLDEVITRLRYDVGHPEAAEFLSLVHDSTAVGALVVRQITQELWKNAEEIFLRYKDSRLSFTDCTSFAYLTEQPVDEVFGYDAHFEMMGHVLRPKP